MIQSIWRLVGVLLVASVCGTSACLAEEERPRAIIQTSMGNLTLELYSDKAPKTVANFIKLAKQGFYNGVIVHRVIPGAMILTGDPTGTGSGGPGYSLPDEFSDDVFHDGPGVVSMSNKGPDTNGSQFLITLAAAPWLDGKNTIFGHLVDGIVILERIGSAEHNAEGRPLKDITIRQILIQQP